MRDTTYYEVLDVTQSSSPSEIKKAYRRLALRYHPDKHGEETRVHAERKFKEISEAYDVLSDPEKKTLYDTYGKDGLRGGGEREGSGRYDSRASDFHFRDPSEIFRTFFGGRDPFEDFFGGSGMMGRGGRGGTRGFFDDDDDDFFGSSSRMGGFMSRGGFGSDFGSPFGNDFESALRSGGRGDFFSSSSSSFGGNGGSFSSTSVRTTWKDGKKVTIKTENVNGKKTETVEEDGKVVKMTIDGVPQRLALDG